MNEDSDEALWQRSISGDHSAFGTIFERHAKRIYNHCFRRVASWALAEDLTSVVFLEAWRKRSSVHLVDHSALPWLLGVATNVCRNATRSLHRHHKALGRIATPVPSEDEMDVTSSRIDAEIEMKKVLDQFDQLSQQDKEVLQLSAWEGLDYEAIAVALDIPIGTVRSRLSRARSRLRVATETHSNISEMDTVKE